MADIAYVKELVLVASALFFSVIKNTMLMEKSQSKSENTGKIWFVEKLEILKFEISHHRRWSNLQISGGCFCVGDISHAIIGGSDQGVNEFGYMASDQRLADESC